MSGFDWPSLMRVGLRGLGLRPAEFWRLTPAEFAFLLGEDSGALPMDRSQLAVLEARFPDMKRTDTNDG